MKFYRIFRTSECEGYVETDAQLTVNGGVVADLTGDVTGGVTGSIGGITVLSGEGAPTEVTGPLNALYVDTTGSDLYICTLAAEGETPATWMKFTRATE